MLDELKQWPQWVVHGPDKIPLRVSDGHNASSTDPSDWCSYDAAYQLIQHNPGYGLGFVLTPNDPFTCIDLDNPRKDTKLTEEQIQKILHNHNQIYNTFNTHAELSPSGEGCHIWCKGAVESRKFSEGKIEVYSKERYMTVTLKPIRNVPITDCQHLLDQLIISIDRVKPTKNGNHSFQSEPEQFTDAQVIEFCRKASYGVEFDKIAAGNWQGLYPTQSEADIVLCNYLAHYTNNKEQVARIYLSSPLLLNSPKRKRKEKHDYLFDNKYGIVTKAFDLKASPEEKAMIQAMQITSIAKAKESLTKGDPTVDWAKPSGLLGDIAHFIHSAAVYPSHEVAIAASIAFMAGICGRAFNTYTNTGLNQYIVLLAGTAQGKEGAASGISKLLKAVQPTVPVITNYFGPSDIASAQGLIKHLSKEPCFMSQKGEIGFWLQQMNSKYAKSTEIGLKRIMLDLFNKSGHSDVLYGSTYSDVAKNVPNIQGPAFTLYGDSTPEEFYKSIDESNISEGLISRFTILSCPMVKPTWNDYAPLATPSPDLIDKIARLVQRVHELNDIRKHCIVQEAEDARAFQVAYREECLDKVWIDKDSNSAKIWHRAHVRLLKLGALIAVGNNSDYPVVTLSDYKWAAKLIDIGVKAIVQRFVDGTVGMYQNGWNEQLESVGKVINKYLACTWQPKRVNKEMLDQRVLMGADIQHQTRGYSCFRHDKNPAFALQNVIKYMVDNGYLREIEKIDAIRWGKSGKCYKVLQNYDLA